MSTEEDNRFKQAIIDAQIRVDKLFKNCQTVWVRIGDLLIPVDRETGKIRKPEMSED